MLAGFFVDAREQHILSGFPSYLRRGVSDIAKNAFRLLERIVESQHTGCVERRGAPGLGNIECTSLQSPKTALPPN